MMNALRQRKVDLHLDAVADTKEVPALSGYSILEGNGTNDAMVEQLWAKLRKESKWFLPLLSFIVMASASIATTATHWVLGRIDRAAFETRTTDEVAKNSSDILRVEQEAAKWHQDDHNEIMQTRALVDLTNSAVTAANAKLDVLLSRNK